MSEKRASGLGRGLAALLDEAARPAAARDATDETAQPRGVREVELARIRPNPAQPRLSYDEE